jgi:putative transposase
VGNAINPKPGRRETARDCEVSMSTFAKLIYHVVFATKRRTPLIKGELQTRLYDYLGGIIRGRSGHLVEVGGVADHIHLLVHLSPKFAVSDVIRDIKGSSSAWVNLEKLSEQHFEWQKGYSAFTVSFSGNDSVQNYIRKQEEHHQRRFLRKNTSNSSNDIRSNLNDAICLKTNITVDAPAVFTALVRLRLANPRLKPGATRFRRKWQFEFSHSRNA